MNLPYESVSGGGNAKSCEPGHGSRLDDLVTFTPMAFDGLTWTRIIGPQQDARAACLLAAAHIHLFRPEVPLRDLDVRAEAAIRALEDGAETIMVIDDRHRVDRVDLGPGVAAPSMSSTNPWKEADAPVAPNASGATGA